MKHCGFDCDQATSQTCECAIDVIVFRARFIFTHIVVAHPMIAYLRASSPSVLVPVFRMLERILFRADLPNFFGMTMDATFAELLRLDRCLVSGSLCG